MLPHFRSRDFLVQHIADALAFLYPRCIDSAGGYVHAYACDAGVGAGTNAACVSGSARLAGDFALAYREFGDPAYLRAASHGLDFLRQTGAQDAPGAAAARLSAYARAARAGVPGAAGLVDAAAAMLQRHTSDQRAGARACAALVEAFEATGELRHLRHAERIASEAITSKIDGGQLAWARALLALDRQRGHLAQGGQWMLAACILFEHAADGDDVEGDGLLAAAMLGERTGRIAYWARYDAFWTRRYTSADAHAAARLIGACHQALEVIASAP